MFEEVSRLEEIRAQRPREVGIARILSIIASVLWLPIFGSLIGFLGSVPLICYVFGSFGAVKGRQTARVMVTAALAVNYLFVLSACWLLVQSISLYAVGYAMVSMVGVLLSVISLVLLYQPASNRYFRLVTVAMQAR